VVGRLHADDEVEALDALHDDGSAGSDEVSGGAGLVAEAADVDVAGRPQVAEGAAALTDLNLSAWHGFASGRGVPVEPAGEGAPGRRDWRVSESSASGGSRASTAGCPGATTTAAPRAPCR